MRTISKEFKKWKFVISCKYKKQAEKIKELLEYHFSDFEYKISEPGTSYYEVLVGSELGLGEESLDVLMAFSAGIYVILNEYVGDV